MANVLTSLRTHDAATTQTAMPARRPLLPRPTLFRAELKKAAEPTPPQTAPDWRELFRGPVYAAPTPAPAPRPNPTAELVFGPNPWIANPTGTAPNGQQYSYNPFYFATRETAAKVAEMAGGTVVEANMLTAGGAFAQGQPNYMVKLNDGRLINPGLVASFYTHGYSQSYVEQMVAAELRNA